MYGRHEQRAAQLATRWACLLTWPRCKRELEWSSNVFKYSQLPLQARYKGMFREQTHFFFAPHLYTWEAEMSDIFLKKECVRSFPGARRHGMWQVSFANDELQRPGRGCRCRARYLWRSFVGQGNVLFGYWSWNTRCRAPRCPTLKRLIAYTQVFRRKKVIVRYGFGNQDLSDQPKGALKIHSFVKEMDNSTRLSVLTRPEQENSVKDWL